MSSEKKLDLNQLQNDVQNEIENEDHNRIANICRTVLASKPNELLWLRLLCCAMIHLSETKSLLKFIESYSNKHQIYNALLFYKIYCLYVLKQNETAQDIINKNEETLKKTLTEQEYIATQYLKFQIFYRLGQYKSALNILNALQNNNEHMSEIAINEISTLIAMNQSSDAIKKYYNDRNNNNSSLYSNCDFVFNLSTALILCERINDAKQFLTSSLSNCENALKKDGYDENEIKSEIANLELLIGYCLYCEGDLEKASEYYNKLSENKLIHGTYQNLILQNNCIAIEYNMNINNADETEEKKENEKGKETIGLYKKLLCGKNKDNFGRIGLDKNGINELMKTYYNNCLTLIKYDNENNKSNKLLFKQLIRQMKNENPLSELPLFIRIIYYLNNNQIQQCQDILYNHIRTNPNASYKSQLYYIQILIKNEKYKMVIKHIQSFENNIKYNNEFINIMLDMAINKLNKKNLAIEIMKECIEYLRNTKAINNELLISLQTRLCQLLISINKASHAKNIANELYKTDANNETYKAMLILAAVHTQDMELAEKISDEIKPDIEYNEFEIEELISDIPKPIEMILNKNDNDNKEEIYSFTINEENELERKREIYRQKREKNANKRREKYKENPELYKEAINWESKKKNNNKKMGNNKNKKGKGKSAKKKNNLSQRPKKKKKSFKGAQGGSGASNKFQVYDIGDIKNKTSKGGKKKIPQHIQKRKKRG